MEKQNYIGRKVKGFSFDDSNEYSYVDGMNKHIVEIGTIQHIYDDGKSARVMFKNDFWVYPVSLIDQHLVPSEQDETELRDQFAMHAMNSLITVFKWKESGDIKALTDWAYIIADSMLKSRKEVKGE